jgi:hypothetical protein
MTKQNDNRPEIDLELLAIMLHHTESGSPAVEPTVRVLLRQIQTQLPAEKIDTILEKAKQGQLSSRYLDQSFTISPNLIDRLLELLDEAATI